VEASRKYKNAIEPVYNNIGLYVALPQESDILCY